MKNMPLRRKIFFSFSVVLFLMLVMVYISITSLIANGKQFRDFYTVSHQVTIKTGEVQKLIQSVAKNVGYATMTRDIDKTGEYIDTAQKNMDEMNTVISQIDQMYRGDKSVLTQIKSLITEFTPYEQQVFDLARENRSLTASNVFFDECQPRLLQIQELIKDLSASATEYADIGYQKSARNERLTILFMIALSVVALVGTMAIAMLLAKSILTPVRELKQAAEEMANGSLNVTIDYESKNELGSLAESLRVTTGGVANIVKDIGYLLGEMAGGNFRIRSRFTEAYKGDYEPILTAMRGINRSLSNTLSQINLSADQVASGSEQVSAGAQALSQGATEQASSIEELAATVNEISGQVKRNAGNAQQARQAAEEAAGNVEAGNEKMIEMNKAMENISDKSKEIGKIVKNIEDIAFQTNILALNAAVEAARAGEAGKGFAVVADEVRNLAVKSGDAAKSTTMLVTESINAVDIGTKIADETAIAMLNVVDSSNRIHDLIESIAKESDEQASAVEQVTQGIDQISSVVQTNSATAEESAASSEELSGQAQILKELVGKFRLREEDQASGATVQNPVLPQATERMRETNLHSDKY